MSCFSTRSNKRVQITAAPQADGSGKKDLSVRPANTATEKNLLYRAWVESRREYVAKVSGGSLGYVHMADMGQVARPALSRPGCREHAARRRRH